MADSTCDLNNWRSAPIIRLPLEGEPLFVLPFRSEPDPSLRGWVLDATGQPIFAVDPTDCRTDEEVRQTQEVLVWILNEKFRAASKARADGGEGELCDDCPPVGYPTDKTRCLPCPRRAQVQS